MTQPTSSSFNQNTSSSNPSTMTILQLSLSNHIPTHSLFLTHKFSLLTLTTPCKPAKSTIIRMGGGPRTFPGGVSKWQWKRMQEKKSKQLLKARVARERQIYEMRKRAELKAAVSELERPWEVGEKAPTLFSARADEQLKVLSDRFQKHGGFDLWSEKDGPQLFETIDGVPSARFFPKGVVHSAKPYGRIGGGDSNSGFELDLNRVLENGGGDRNGYRRIGDNFGGDSGLIATGSDLKSGDDGKMGVKRNWYIKNSRNLRSGYVRERDYKGEIDRSGNVDSYNGKFMRKVNGKRPGFRESRSESFTQEEERGSKMNGRRSRFWDSRSGSIRAIRAIGEQFSRGNGLRKLKSPNSEVFDMSMQNDGSYEFSNRELEIPKSRKAEQ